MGEGWMVDAACRAYDPELFFDLGGGPSLRRAAALEVCRDCPVVMQCRAHAAALRCEGPLWGVWGGRVWTSGTTRGEARTILAQTLAVM